MAAAKIGQKGPTMKPNVNNIFYPDAQATLDTSTTKSDYRPWAIDRRSPIKADHNLKTPRMTTQTSNLATGHSTYLNDYKKYEQPSVSIVKPDYSKKTVLRAPTNAQFDASTRYKDTYVPHQLPDKFVRPREQYVKNANSLDSLTVSHRDYTIKNLEMRKPFKPSSNDLFDFTPRKIEPPKTWAPPADPMHLTTSYSKDYEPKSVDRTQKIRPISRKRTTGKFVGDTTYGKEFQAHNGHEQASPIRNTGELQLPNQPFGGESTYRGNYQQPPALSEQRRPFKPTSEQLFPSPEVPFEGNTSYRSEFTPKDGERATFDRARSNNIFEHKHSFRKKP